MGCCISSLSSHPSILTVATLNYSGILTSPYEYYQYDNNIQKNMNQIFRTYVLQKYPDFDKINQKGQPLFQWRMGSIDTKWKDRYAPINILQAGIKKSGTMMNQQQFIIQWEEKKQQTIKDLEENYFNRKKVDKAELQKIKEEQLQMCKQFDLLTYQTFLKAYCGVSDFKNIGNIQSKRYFQERKKQFQKPFLSESNKLHKTISSINTIGYDILFFQQTNKTLVQGLKNQAEDYYVITKQNSGSVILIKKYLCPNDISFERSNQKFLQKYRFQLKRKLNQDVQVKELADRLNFNNDSIFQGFEKFLLINVHISSKSEINKKQIKQFTAEVRKILMILPNYSIICGGDFNARLNKSQILLQKKQQIKQTDLKKKDIQYISIAPDLDEDSKNVLSVKKKRTLMQPQRHKAQKLDQQTKDFLISTMQMQKRKIVLIDGSQIKKDSPLPLLPNSVHPYDHYMILVQLKSYIKSRFQ